jgi:LysM repeat protein
MDTDPKSRRVLSPFKALIMIALTGLVMIGLVFGVTWLADNSSYWGAPDWNAPESAAQFSQVLQEQPATSTPSGPMYTPTPDPPHALPAIREKTETYTVKSGDSLGVIAQRYGISLEQLIKANDLANPNILEVGQVLTVPVPAPDTTGPGFKIILLQIQPDQASK